MRVTRWLKLEMLNFPQTGITDPGLALLEGHAELNPSPVANRSFSPLPRLRGERGWG